MIVEISLVRSTHGGYSVCVGDRQVGQVLETSDGQWLGLSADLGVLGLPVSNQFAAVHKVLDTALTRRRIVTGICGDPQEDEDTAPEDTIPTRVWRRG